MAYDEASYREGFRARLAGKTIHENPYATFTSKHSNWQDGWKAQDEHLSARDDALDSIELVRLTPRPIRARMEREDERREDH